MVTIRESARARRMSLVAYPTGEIVLVKPKRVSLEKAHAFIKQYAGWIERQIARIQKLPGPPRYTPGGTKAEYARYKAAALTLVRKRIAHFAPLLGVSPLRITIRNQKARWGSCSRDGSISINYKVALLPEHLADYIIVHELAHMKEFNHSVRFWSEVASVVPDYRACRRELRSRGAY